MVSKSAGYFLAYTALSIALFGWSIEDSLRNSVNFNIFLIELTDGFKLGVLINFIVFLFISIDKALQLILFGELRIIETEHLIEKMPYFAFNLFFNFATNDSNHLLTIILVGMSISFKIFHVILFDRLDFVNMKIMNNSSGTKFQLLRKYLTNFNFWLNLIFIVLDFAIAKFLVYDVIQGINSVTCLLFGFQFAVQGVEALTYYSKLLLNVFELVYFRDSEEEEDDPVNLDADEDDDDNELRVWENKPYFSKGIDIASESLKAISYLCFIYLLTVYSELSLPLAMLQGTYSSLRQAYTEVKQLMAFIESSKRLDSQLPTATKEDLDASDNLCIICREDMYSPELYQAAFKKPLASRKCPKKLICGHILHMGCLKEWLERSDSCPMCRRKVFEGPNPESAPQDDTRAAPTETPATNTPTNTQPPFNHPVEELERRLEEFTNLIHRRERTLDDHQPTPTQQQNTSSLESTENAPAEGTSASSQTPAYQTIRLPSNAVLPPNWIILPLEKQSTSEVLAAGSQAGYRVNFSTKHQGTLQVKPKERNSELTLIRPS
ncbi:uncharacterized protein CANTADRAFT_196212 [Suhomyces tanzawaensis NRRL Y-17324]|uniref:RING-type E3 ubiquitin transferase n=1 Tax=Suhomyces tanzawaensis NRRL Y-17324 TaxID=984487 RepID=A0A1E4SPA3_9ASCO|nr:uncharacterized protein CANTADRAFT_196212 [Suhomyces tanzawaensis NRRL Y-17324]ODV81212.1 hypothetical protein CANTADRAFT_196212 [Suhomyces tanzawaensis NRRL Y-17324]